MNNVNKYFYEKLVRLSSGLKSDEFIRLTKRAQHLSSLKINSDEKMKKYFLLKDASREIGAVLTEKEFRHILDLDIESKNDAFYLIVKSKLNSREIKKLAYPSYGLSPDDIDEEYDVGAWLELVYKIYNSIESGEMSKENAIEYYSNSLDIKEREGFLKWFEYYRSGEHLKYSFEEELDMKKKAVYQSDLGQGNNPYYSGSGSSYLDKNTGNNMPGDSFGRRTFEEASGQPKRTQEEQSAFSTWKQQLYGAIRRVDKLIRSDRYVGHEEYRDLSEALNSLSILAKKVKLARTLSDVTYKTASTFERAGAGEAANILKKIAQEVPEDVGLPSAEPVAAQETPTATPIGQPQAVEEGAPTAEPEKASEGPESASGIQIPDPNEVDPAKLKDITPLPGAKPNEYDELAGEISLETAASKLDEVAGMLADRRIIRQLAEFDIMLDKIGIASMFPELAESQSKLIDSFSYALTRVTKMMGQLANAKTLMDANTGVPGSQAGPDSEPQGEEVVSPDNLDAEEVADLPSEE